MKLSGSWSASNGKILKEKSPFVLRIRDCFTLGKDDAPERNNLEPDSRICAGSRGLEVFEHPTSKNHADRIASFVNAFPNGCGIEVGNEIMHHLQMYFHNAKALLLSRPQYPQYHR